MKYIHPRKWFNGIRNRCRTMHYALRFIYSVFYVDIWYGDFWNFRDYILKNHLEDNENSKEVQYYRNYLEFKNAFIGLHAKIKDKPVMPHGLSGVFISESAEIGKNVTIFQHVTIGSNMLSDSSHYGAPVIGNNVVIGAGTVVIGNVKIGENCRIGAGAVVYKDVPENSTVVMRSLEILSHKERRDNTFVANVRD